MTEFLIGCTHFGHARIIELAYRKFASVNEMDEEMVQRWNGVVRPKDTVFHLGDFSWISPQRYLSRLNGNLVLFQGNHDPSGWGHPYLELKRNKKHIVLCHYPIEEWNGHHKGWLHFHAHIHSPNFVSAPNRGHVGADAIDYTPIPIEEAVAKLSE